MPSLSNAYIVARVLGVSLERLLTGQELLPEVPDKEKLYDLIPWVEGRISCGPGGLPSNEIKDWLWIPKKFLHRKPGYEYQFAAIEVAGTSMEPLVSNGEIVVIDRGECDTEHIRRESIYAVWKEGQSYVKFLHYDKAEGLLHLISYNADYTRQQGVEHIRIKKGMDNPVMGKVVFSFRRWK